MNFFDFVLVPSPNDRSVAAAVASPKEQEFIALCEKGSVSSAMQFLSMNKYLDISAKNEQAFRTACEYGHLPLAKALIAYKPSIEVTAHDNYAFRYAYANGHWETAHWVYGEMQKETIHHKK